MKALIPFLTLFLASCGVHHHRYDADEDAYYQEDYYAYGNYDPYYGYGSTDYTYAGDGIYYNNYNYYPDRWGVTYSNAYYSPFRYPRVGFYYSSSYNCGFSYWSTGCYSYWPSHYYASNGWFGFGLGLSYSSYYYDNYWWYNHWRNRNYQHNNYYYKPTQRGRYSARNEVRRLNRNNSSYRYKENNQNTRRYNKPIGVDRSRSRSTYRSPARSQKPSRTQQPAQRSRQQLSNNKQPVTSSSSRGQISTRSRDNNQSLQDSIRNNHRVTNLNSSRYQKPARVTTIEPNRSATRVKPMSSQSPVYQTNRIAQPRVNNRGRQNSVPSNRSAVNRVYSNNKTPQPQQSPNIPVNSKPIVNKPVNNNKPTRKRSSDKRSNRSKSSNSSERSGSSKAVGRNRDHR